MRNDVDRVNRLHVRACFKHFAGIVLARGLGGRDLPGEGCIEWEIALNVPIRVAVLHSAEPTKRVTGMIRVWPSALSVSKRIVPAASYRL
jgi:hypothetical protein